MRLKSGYTPPFPGWRELRRFGSSAPVILNEPKCTATTARRECSLDRSLLPIQERRKMKMTTEEAFVKVLQKHGIEHAFGIIGSAMMPVSDLFPAAGITFWDLSLIHI